MKFYVIIKGEKEYIDVDIISRRQLAYQLGSQYFFLKNNRYHVNEVYAENDNTDAISGAVVGGLVGLLGGPVGLVIGGILGGLVGSNNSDTDKVKKFNNNYV